MAVQIRQGLAGPVPVGPGKSGLGGGKVLVVGPRGPAAGLETPVVGPLLGQAVEVP